MLLSARVSSPSALNTSASVMAFMMVVIYLQELHNVHVKDKKKTERNNRLFDIPIFSDAWFERNTSTSQPTLDNIPTYTF